MSLNTWVEALVTAQGDGTALTNTTTATSLLPAAAKFTLPANFFTSAGKMLRIKAAGRISTAASTPGTFTFDVRFGSTVVVGSWTSGTLAVSAANLTWELEANLVCRAIGQSTTANILGTGRLISAALSATTPILLLPAASPAVGTGFDSTAAQAVDFFGTWSVASASNTITLHQYSLEALN
jgi:hypothetical protein